jgi:hypothetical protein
MRKPAFIDNALAQIVVLNRDRERIRKLLVDVRKDGYEEGRKRTFADINKAMETQYKHKKETK